MRQFEVDTVRNCITICFPKNEIENNYDRSHGFYNYLLDWLGDFDVVSASELAEGHMVISGRIFVLTNKDLESLEIGNIICVSLGKTLDEWIKKHPENIDFYNWYYGNQDE